MINIVHSNLSSLVAINQIRRSTRDNSFINIIFCSNKENISLDKKINNNKNDTSRQVNIYVHLKSNAVRLSLTIILKNFEKYCRMFQVYRTIGYRIYMQQLVNNQQILKQIENDYLDKYTPFYSRYALDFLRIQRKLEKDKNEIIYDLSEDSYHYITNSHNCQGAHACVILLSTQVDISPDKFLMCKSLHIYSPDKHDLFILSHLVSARKIIFGHNGPQRFPINFYDELEIECHEQT
jgi:hypothetical protein